MWIHFAVAHFGVAQESLWMNLIETINILD